jgi:hypothetical protein
MGQPQARSHYLPLPRSEGDPVSGSEGRGVLGLPGVASVARGLRVRHCGHSGGWQLGDRRIERAGRGCRTSVTAGTIFDRTRTPLASG